MVGGRPLEWYWPGIQWPVIIAGGWSILGLVFALVSWQLYIDIFTFPALGTVIAFGSFLLAGYVLFMQRKAKAKEATWGGALVGIITGLIGLVVFFVMMSQTQLLSWTLQEAMAKVAASGQAADPDMLRNMMKLTMTIGAVLGPVINGLFGALFGWFGYLLAKKIE